MDLESLIKKAKTQSEYSQLFIKFNSRVHTVTAIVSLVEERGSDIVAMEIVPAEDADSRIACFKLKNDSIQDIVVSLHEIDYLSQNLGLEACGCGPAVQPEKQT